MNWKNKELVNAYKRNWRENNKEKVLESSQKWHRNNKEKEKEYRERNKEKIAKYKHIWFKKNKKHIREYRLKNKRRIQKYNKDYSRIYYKKNKDEMLKNNKEWRLDNIILDKQTKKKYYRKMCKLYPWYNSFNGAKLRCNSPFNRNYKNYGGRGIRFKLTKDEMNKLWFRDKAYLLKKPTIDRIDNDGNYQFSNCQWIELSENAKKGRIDANN